MNPLQLRPDKILGLRTIMSKNKIKMLLQSITFMLSLGILFGLVSENVYGQCITNLDYFRTVGYSNNDGTTNFLNDWVETNDDGDPATGVVYIDPVFSDLVMSGNGGACTYVERSVDLSDNPYISAIFSTDFVMTGGPTDVVNVQVSDDAGASFTTVGTLTGGDGTSSTFFNLSPYVGSMIILRIETCGFEDPGESAAFDFLSVYACEEEVNASGCSDLVFRWEDVNGNGQVWNMDDQGNTYTISSAAGTSIDVTVTLIDPDQRNSESDIRDAGNHPFDPAGGCGYYTGNGEEAGWPNMGSITDPWDSDCSPIWTETGGAYGPDYLTWVINTADHNEEVTLEFCFSSPVVMEDFRISDIDFSGLTWDFNNVDIFEVPGNSFQDELFAYALDINGDTVDIDMTPSATGYLGVNSSPTVEHAYAIYDTDVFGNLSPTDPLGEVSISSTDLISCLYLVYSNGVDDALDEQANVALYDWWSAANGPTNGVSDDQAIRIDGFTACVCEPFDISIQGDTVCLGDTGTIVINGISGGIPPFEYLWGDADSTTTDSIAYVSPTEITYLEVVVVTGADGCQDSIVGLVDVIDCCPELITLDGPPSICTEDTTAGPFDLTITHGIADSVGTIALYYSMDSTLTAATLYGAPFGGGATLIDTIATSGTTSVYGNYSLPPNTGTTVVTHCFYAILEENNPFINEPNCTPMVMTCVDVYPLPDIAPAALEDCDNYTGTANFNLTLVDSIVDVNGGNTVTYHATQADADSGAGALAIPHPAGDSTIVFVRVENSFGCYRTDSVLLTIRCCPTLTDVVMLDSLCTMDAQAGPVDITINHGDLTGTLAVYYTTDATLTETDLYGSPYGGGATLIDTIETVGTSSMLSYDFPANATDLAITYCVYVFLQEGHPDILDPECLPYVMSCIDIYPLPDIAPTEVEACDNGDATGDFILTSADSIVDVSGGNTVTYHTTLADAESATAPLATPHVVVDGTVVYARVENVFGCYRTDTVLLTLLPSPILNDATIDECDLGDGTAEFDLSGVNFYYSSEADALVEANPLPNSYITSGDTIYIRVNATNGCFTIREVILEVLPLPTVVNAQLNECDQGDGTADFTLTDADAIIDVNGASTVTYHETQLQALQGLAALLSPYNASDGTMLFARVVDTNSCINYAELLLEIDPLPEVADATLESCDIGGDMAQFILSDADSLVDVSGGSTVTYHTTQAEADSAQNALNNTYISPDDTLFVRVETDAGCFLTSELYLTVLPLPLVADTTLHVCDDGTGTGTFDLTNANATIDVDGGNTITYHSTLAAAGAGNPTLVSPMVGSDGQVVYARIEDANGCFDIAQIILMIEQPPPAVPIEILGCDNGDGTADFPLSLEASNIDTMGGNTVTYHLTQAEADSALNALSNPYNAVDGVIYARVESIYGCYSTAEIILTVQASPILTNTELVECDRGDGLAEFDLSGLGITYYPSLLDAEGETNPLGSSFISTGNDTIYSRVNATNGCYTIAQVLLIVVPNPVVPNLTYTACDIDGSGDEDVDFADIDALLDPTGTASINYFDDQINAFNNLSPLSSPFNTMGGDTLYYRFANASACFSLGEVYLELAPSPEVANAQLEACDDGDGIIDFDIASLVDSVDVNGGNMVSFHSDLNGAMNDTAEVTSPYASAGGETIYARVETVDGCYQIATIQLDVLVAPVLMDSELEECDQGDGTAEFDLSNSAGNYYMTQADAMAEVNPLGASYTTALDTIYQRVNSTNGCFSVAQTILIVLPLPEVQNATLEDCDDNGDNLVPFDLTTAIADIDTSGLNTVTFHSSVLDVTTGNNALVSPYSSGSTTLFARVVSPDGCYTVAELELIVTPCCPDNNCIQVGVQVIKN